jgi:formylglycine-generating enzyme required for sulfatase activity
VDFLDAKEMTIPVETAKKAGVGKGDSAKVEDMSAGELAEVKKTVEQTKKSSADIDLKRMANTVDGYTPKPNYIVKSAVDMEMIWCPPGSFIMGPSGEGSPAHPAILTKGFYLGKYEVTQEQYQKVIRKNPSNSIGDTLPVEYVSWKEAVAFCRVLNKMERTLPGWEFALPTEAEWEYACRAGTTTAYSWGNNVSPQLANYEESGLKKTVQVGSYKANPWGFYDMHGNVYEWTADWFGDYHSRTVTDPQGAASGSGRVARGSSYYTDELSMFSATRRWYPPNDRSANLGFRVAIKQQ